MVPWLPQAAWLPAEDALDLERAAAIAGPAQLKVVVPMLSRIANFDDLDPLGLEPGVRLVFVRPGEPMPGDADVVILPGSKSTVGDLAFLRRQGWDIDLGRTCAAAAACSACAAATRCSAARSRIRTASRGRPGTVDGSRPARRRDRDDGRQSRPPGARAGTARPAPRSRGYEIHLGRTEGGDCARPMVTIGDRPDGAASADGHVQGTYVHGLFGSDEFRRAWLAQFAVASAVAYEATVERAIDALADHLEAHLDVDAILAIARSRHTRAPAWRRPRREARAQPTAHRATTRQRLTRSISLANRSSASASIGPPHTVSCSGITSRFSGG